MRVPLGSRDGPPAGRAARDGVRTGGPARPSRNAGTRSRNAQLGFIPSEMSKWIYTQERPGPVLCCAPPGRAEPRPAGQPARNRIRQPIRHFSSMLCNPPAPLPCGERPPSCPLCPPTPRSGNKVLLECNSHCCCCPWGEAPARRGRARGSHARRPSSRFAETSLNSDAGTSGMRCGGVESAAGCRERRGWGLPGARGGC